MEANALKADIIQLFASNGTENDILDDTFLPESGEDDI